MKKIGILGLVMFSLAGCTSSMYVTTVPTYLNTVNEVVAKIEEQGYTFTEKKHDHRNEFRNSATVHEWDPAFAEKIPNNLVNVDTYCFIDSAGNTMQFEVQFRSGVDHQSGAVYFNEVQTVGCFTSNSKDYDRLCGERSPIRMLDTIHKDMIVKP